MKIDFQGNKAEFEIRFELYDFPSIIQAAKEFTETCWVAIMPSEDKLGFHMKIEPKSPEADVKDAVYSFFNYTLGIMHGKMKDFAQE